VLWGLWLALQTVPESTASAPPVIREQPLAIPRRGELALARARTLAARGHLSDALVMLDSVRPTDAQRADADRLRADIQRQLLALVAAGQPPAAEREKGDRRVP
jgi:hypothetical protein